MHNQLQPAVTYDDEIDLRELFSALWLSRRLIAIITTTTTALALIYVLLTPNQYQADAVLAPTEQGGGGLSSALSQFGGLASLAGINLGDSQGNEARIAQQVMQSRSFIEQFIKQSGIAVEIMAVKGWDAKTDDLKIDADIYNSGSRQWTRTPPKGKLAEPSPWELYKVFLEMLSVTEDKKSGFVTISIEYFSPYLAKQWVDNYILAVNLYLQQRKLSSINKNIQYLEEQIEITSVAEMRQIFFTLIEEQIKNKMLVEASPDYAFVTVSEAMVPEEESQPKRLLIVILAALLGTMLSIIIALMRFYWLNRYL